MNRTLLMETLLGETRLAVIEDGRLCEIYIERPNGDDVTGSIYLGRVENVVPGMNAAFVDIGQSKNGFLSAGDIPIMDQGLSRQLKDQRIEKLVRRGQAILVQVLKAQSGQKGHRLSCHIALPGRLMVLLTDVRYIGVSKKITESPERDRLRMIAQALTDHTPFGVIMRTASEWASDDEIRREWVDLLTRWEGIENQAQYAMAPTEISSNTSLARRVLRDMLDDTVDLLWVDDDHLFKTLTEQASEGQRAKIRRHEGEIPLFDIHRVDAQLNQALRKYVWLKSGGSLVIQETEAMTVIDVNTAKFTGKRDLEETLFRLNREAAEEILRQLRLRDIGGIIIVDFIDMKDQQHNEALLEQLRTLSKTDRNRLTVVGMTNLGLVELTRKRVRKPLSQQLLRTCGHCGGDGITPGYETIARGIERELWRRRRTGDETHLVVRANPEVQGWLKTLGRPTNHPVDFIANPALAPENYEIAPFTE